MQLELSRSGVLAAVAHANRYRWVLVFFRLKKQKADGLTTVVVYASMIEM